MNFKIEEDAGQFGSDVAPVVAAIKRLGRKQVLRFKVDDSETGRDAMKRVYQRIYAAGKRAGVSVSGRVLPETGHIVLRRRIRDDDRTKRARKASPKGACS